MRALVLNDHNRQLLTALVNAGGIVLCEDYFLVGFTKSCYEEDSGYWVNTCTAYGGVEEEYSFFAKDGDEIAVECFIPVRLPLK